MKKAIKTMPILRELWVEACEDIWDMSEYRPRVRDEATLWEAFRYLYLSRVKNAKLSSGGEA